MFTAEEELITADKVVHFHSKLTDLRKNMAVIVE
jgi:hypothetical protein